MGTPLRLSLLDLASYFLPRSEFKLESLNTFEAKNDFQTLANYISSIDWKLRLASYHVSKALAAIPGLIPEYVIDKGGAAVVLQMKVMSGDDEGEPMVFAQLETEAHAIAAAQALDSVPDILVQSLYLAFRLDAREPLREGQRTIQNVIRILRETGLSSISETLTRLQDSDIFTYLRAFVNTTKHRSLINMLFSASVVDSEDFGLTIAAFRFEHPGGRVDCWPSRTIKEFLEYALAYMSAAADTIRDNAAALIMSFAGSPVERFWFKLEPEIVFPRYDDFR